MAVYSPRAGAALAVRTHHPNQQRTKAERLYQIYHYSLNILAS
ncbi:MAG: hypothetical protein LBM62_05165 [Mediterranea sp.]|nr:hypothetical protein [Mediterranea sp.]